MRTDRPTGGHLLVLACSDRKITDRGRLPALELYDGVNYRVLRAFLNERGWPPGLMIKILSAKYGLIDATTIIDPYDQRLDEAAARQMNRAVLKALARIGTPSSVFVNLGQDYLPAVEGIEQLFAGRKVVHTEGGIGLKMAQTKKWLRSLPAATATLPRRKGGTGDGLVTINEVDGIGFKSFTARSADLDGSNGLGFNLTGFAGSITIGNVSNGADVLLSGPQPTPTSATSIKAGVIGDGTNIMVAAPLRSLTAVAIGRGTITAPSAGSIRVRGRSATNALPAIAGDLRSDITISGAGFEPVRGMGLGSLAASGAVSGAAISVDGNVGSVSVGQFLSSNLFAGYAGPVTGNPAGFVVAATVDPFVTTAGVHGFADSYVIATNVKAVTLSSVDTTGAAPDFGFDFHGTFAGLTAKNPRLLYNKSAGGTQVLKANFEVEEI